MKVYFRNLKTENHFKQFVLKRSVCLSCFTVSLCAHSASYKLGNSARHNDQVLQIDYARIIMLWKVQDHGERRGDDLLGWLQPYSLALFCVIRQNTVYGLKAFIFQFLNFLEVLRVDGFVNC